MYNCPVCNLLITRPEYNYCARCGTNQSEARRRAAAVPDQPQPERSCPSCELKTRPHWNFCPRCTYPLAPSQYQYEYSCPPCGGKVEPRWNVCPWCGRPLVSLLRRTSANMQNFQTSHPQTESFEQNQNPSLNPTMVYGSQAGNQTPQGYEQPLQIGGRNQNYWSNHLHVFGSEGETSRAQYNRSLQEAGYVPRNLNAQLPHHMDAYASAMGQDFQRMRISQRDLSSETPSSAASRRILVPSSRKLRHEKDVSRVTAQTESRQLSNPQVRHEKDVPSVSAQTQPIQSSNTFTRLEPYVRNQVTSSQGSLLNAAPGMRDERIGKPKAPNPPCSATNPGVWPFNFHNLERHNRGEWRLKVIPGTGPCLRCKGPHPTKECEFFSQFIEIWVQKGLPDFCKAPHCQRRETHTTLNHGLGEWRDHPENPALPLDLAWISLPWNKLPYWMPLPKYYYTGDENLIPSPYAPKLPEKYRDKGLKCGLWDTSKPFAYSFKVVVSLNQRKPYPQFQRDHGYPQDKDVLKDYSMCRKLIKAGNPKVGAKRYSLAELLEITETLDKNYAYTWS